MSFDDLPIDGVWLVYRHVIIDFYKNSYSLNSYSKNVENNIHFNGPAIYSPMTELLRQLSTVNKRSLKMVRSKVVMVKFHAKHDFAWAFKPGSIIDVAAASTQRSDSSA